MIYPEVIEALFKEELTEANLHHRETFASPHEAYAVLKEEIEEAAEDLEDIKILLEDIWILCRGDEPMMNELATMHNLATSLVQESVQVGAMAMKALRSLYGGDKNA